MKNMVQKERRRRVEGQKKRRRKYFVLQEHSSDKQSFTKGIGPFIIGHLETMVACLGMRVLPRHCNVIIFDRSNNPVGYAGTENCWRKIEKYCRELYQSTRPVQAG